MEQTALMESQGEASALSSGLLLNADVSTDDVLRRRQLRRERNMRAAKRCRERREEQRKLVDEEIKILEKENEELRIKINTLMNERESLRRFLTLPPTFTNLSGENYNEACDMTSRSYNSAVPTKDIQQADKKMVQQYKVLKRIADQMCTWEDVETLAVWLEYHPREVRRLRSENQTLRSSAYQILTLFCDRTSVSNAKRWEMIRDALCEMNKNSAVIELGIDQLIQETFSDTMSEMDLEEIHKENQILKNARLCKVCKDTDAIKVFLPCGHLSDCRECQHVTTSPTGMDENDPVQVRSQSGQEARDKV